MTVVQYPVPDGWTIKTAPPWMVDWHLVGVLNSWTSHWNKTIYMAADLVPGSVQYECVKQHELTHAHRGLSNIILWPVLYAIGIVCLPLLVMSPVLLLITHWLLWIGVVAGLLITIWFSQDFRLSEEIEAESMELFTRWRLLGFEDSDRMLLRFMSADKLHLFARPYWMFRVSQAEVRRRILEATRYRIRSYLNVS